MELSSAGRKDALAPLATRMVPEDITLSEMAGRDNPHDLTRMRDVNRNLGAPSAERRLPEGRGGCREGVLTYGAGEGGTLGAGHTVQHTGLVTQTHP